MVVGGIWRAGLSIAPVYRRDGVVKDTMRDSSRLVHTVLLNMHSLGSPLVSL